jgi:hypothetical protein
MKNLTQLEESVKSARQHKNAADLAAASIANTLKTMPTDGFTTDFLNKKTAELRAKHVPAITNALAEIVKIADTIRSSEPSWSNTELILSKRPVTESGHPFAGAKDQLAEAAVRHSKMVEYGKMSMPLLALHAADALENNRLGEFYLLNQENNTRTADKNYQPFDLSKVQLPDRDQALSHLREVRAIQMELENVWREAEGRPVNPVDRINAARMAEGVIYAD